MNMRLAPEPAVAGDELPAAPGALDAGDEKVNILIVDDLPDKLLVFGTVLEELKQNLVFVRSGREALREVLRREFAVILLDVNMPGMDGFETAALLRRYRHSADTPIIFITSYADEMQTERGYSLGAVDYILSPVVPHVLRSKVRVFVRLFALQRQIRRQADAHAALAAADAARRVAEDNDRRSALLAHASRTLNGSLDPQVTLRALAALAVPQLASVALAAPSEGADDEPVHAVLAAGSSTPVAIAPARLADPLRAALREALRTRAPVALDPAHAAALDERAFALHEGALRGAAVRAVLAVPLLNADRLLGVLLVAATRPQQSDDWTLLPDLAARAATALENARLYGSLQSEIVERRAAEAQLQEQSRRKDEFLAMLSHELRNPLAPIRTALEVIRRMQPPEAQQPRFAWAADIMDRQLRQMTRLIDELLDVARISRGKIALSREKVDLNAVIAHSVETAQPAVDARRQRLRVRPFAEPVWLNGDFARLAQVLSNLLHNASKYSDEGAEIELAAALERGGAVMRVRDRGIGIDTELLPHVFDLFTQGQRGLDRAQGGLGVGLTLARRLVQMHGGSIEAASEGPGRGAEFTVRLPGVGLVRGEAEDAGAGDAPEPAGCRVLVVDDNRDAAMSIATFLEMNGHEVRTAGDGAQALEMAARFEPHAVLLDIGLPVLDGYEVARRLRAAPPMRAALMLALTGYGQEEDQRAAREAGFDRHFVKPADPEAIVQCLAEWLRTRGDARGDRASGDA